MLLKQNQRVRETLRHLQWLNVFLDVSISLASPALAAESSKSCTSYFGSTFKANFTNIKLWETIFSDTTRPKKKNSRMHQAIILYFLEKLESHQVVCSVEWV